MQFNIEEQGFQKVTVTIETLKEAIDLERALKVYLLELNNCTVKKSLHILHDNLETYIRKVGTDYDHL